jgi:ribosomal-protein-alanine N-acetyltransferase
MSAPFTVRKMRWADLDRILEIERASFGADAYDRKLFADCLHTPEDLFLTAGRGRKVWGYLMGCSRGRRAELVSIAVDPAARGEGAASALIESALRRWKRRRIERVSLTVKTSNRQAETCYLKYGFRRVRRVCRYYEDGSDGWRMARNM